MALTGVTSQGFEFVGLTSGEEVFLLPGDPGVTFTRGDAVIITDGVLVLATDSTIPVGFVDKTTVCPAATQAASPPAEIDKIEDAAADKCWIPIKMNVPGGVPKFRVTFAGHADDAVVSYSGAGASSYVQLTTQLGNDNDSNGAICYVYDGPGKGEILMVADYDDAGGTPNAKQILHRQAKATLTTSSSVITLEGEGSGVGGIGFLGRCDAADHNNVDMSDGYDDGDFVLFFGAKEAPSLLQDEQVIVIPATACGWI